MTKTTLGRRAHLIYRFYLQCIMKGRQGRNLGQGPGGRNCSRYRRRLLFPGLLRTLHYNPGPPAWGGTATICQRDAPTAHCDGGSYSCDLSPMPRFMSVLPKEPSQTSCRELSMEQAELGPSR